MIDEQYNEQLAMIVITNITENDDGSATYTFDIDDVSSKKITELGLEFILTCAAYRLDIQDALTHLMEYGKSDALMKPENITLDYDGDGIWLVEETFDGDDCVVKQMGHISWATIAVYIREYLQ
jgi:hypothetical protein